MALYGSSGNMFRGHPTVPKSVIDYVVLERPLELPAAKTPWRIAGKLPPQSPWKQEQSQPKALHVWTTNIYSQWYVCVLIMF